MSASGIDWFRRYTGKAEDEVFRHPTWRASTERYVTRAKSRHPLISLGWGDGDEVYFSQEDRASHMHILGATQEGKSKLIELLIRDDIKKGYGACLIDPTRGGATAYKILNYCADIGYEKVCLIDPADIIKFGRVPAIQPMRSGIPEAVVNGNLMDMTRVLWSADDFSKNPRIQRYLPAVLQALIVNELTLAEIRYFLSNVDYFDERAQLLAHPGLDGLNRNHILGAFKNTLTYEHFQSTVNRMSPFNDPLLRLMLGSRKTWGGKEEDAYWGLPWSKLVTEGWVILFNADPTAVWGFDNPVPQRILGTLIIGELVYTIGRLLNRGWQGAYNLYVDEAGYYATRKISTLLDYHAKTGLRLILAHQRFNQIEDDTVLSAIRTNAKNKVLFNTPNTVDRDIMLRDMRYGGDLPDRQVSYILSQLQKGQAAISIGKKPPKITRIKNIPDVNVGSKQLTSFKEKLYSHEWYYAAKEIEQEINDRFRNKTPIDLNPTEQVRHATTGRRRSGKAGKNSAGRAGADRKPAGGNRPRTTPEGGAQGFFPEGDD